MGNKAKKPSASLNHQQSTEPTNKKRRKPNPGRRCHRCWEYRCICHQTLPASTPRWRRLSFTGPGGPFPGGELSLTERMSALTMQEEKKDSGSESPASQWYAARAAQDEGRYWKG
ncbi:hypothetical protein MMC17_006651 [Xylographa soralifera]|nr:hypothetical protein [Xylographa soralifera]